jgi:opacity protein-like surface antigen
MHVSFFSRLVCVILVIGTLAAPAPARGQSLPEAGTWSVTPFLSGSFGTSGGLGSSLGVGAAVAYDVTPNLAVEGEIGHAFDVVGDESLVDWSLTTVSANAVYHFDVVGFTPYATFGLGLERSNVSADDVPETLSILLVPSSTEISYNFGGGVKYRLQDKILLRGDLRRFQANDAAPDHWRLYGGLAFTLRR